VAFPSTGGMAGMAETGSFTGGAATTTGIGAGVG